MAKKVNFLSVIAVLEVLETGDIPIKVLAEDENPYLIKHSIKCNTLPNLAREWICQKIFKYFGVSTGNSGQADPSFW